MLLKKGGEIPSSEITPKDVYMNRREFMKGSAVAVGAVALGAYSLSRLVEPDSVVYAGSKLPGVVKGSLSTTGEKLTPYGDITTYNNFYEYGTDKYSPSKEAWRLKTEGWKVKVDGHCAKPQTFDLDALMKLATLEERVYRHRCVEGWSMVIPWAGFPLKALIDRAEPTSKAKFVAFTTLYNPSEMPGQNSDVLQWPYVEGLRMDEALNPLTLLTFGLYGEALPKQDGAPVRVVIPWKYGFKSIKSLVRVKFVEEMPPTTWNIANAHEYGFYSNVNPNVDHPRWSQKTERRIGDPWWWPKRPTLMFNGYGDLVAAMYTGMDLKKWF
jgi:sulfoxide reductase catalytic subunit YedY